MYPYPGRPLVRMKETGLPATESIHEVKKGSNNTNGIGSLGEKSLHAELKQWYSRHGDQLETVIDGFHIDIVRDDLLIEVQTRSLSSLRKKLEALIDNYTVRVVHPVAQEKRIRHQKPGRRPGRARRSPKTCDVMDLFPELVSIPAFMTHPNFSLEVLLIVEEEIRIDDGRGSWRRKRQSLGDHRLVEVRERHVFHTPADLFDVLPAGLPREFTTKDIADLCGRPRWIAQKTAYCLREMEAIHVVGKRGNALVYTTADTLTKQPG